MEEIRKLLEKGRLVLGTKETIKKLRNNEVEKIFIAKNCKPENKRDVIKLAKLGSVDVEELDMTNEDFGTFCKKPFYVSVASVIKEE